MSEIEPGIAPCVSRTKLLRDLLQTRNCCCGNGACIRWTAELSFDVPKTREGFLFDTTSIRQQSPPEDDTNDHTPHNEPNSPQMLARKAEQAPRQSDELIGGLQVFPSQPCTITRPLIRCSHVLSLPCLRLPQ